MPRRFPTPSTSSKILQLIPGSTPLRVFEDHEGTVNAVVVFPTKRRMVTGSFDKTLRLWDLETGVVLKKMEGHSGRVKALAVSRDGQKIASGDENGELIVRLHGKTGECITQPIKPHSHGVSSVELSPDGTMLATGSFDRTTKLWCTKTWQIGKENQSSVLTLIYRETCSRRSRSRLAA